MWRGRGLERPESRRVREPSASSEMAVPGETQGAADDGQGMPYSTRYIAATAVWPAPIAGSRLGGRYQTLSAACLRYRPWVLAVSLAPGLTRGVPERPAGRAGGPSISRRGMAGGVRPPCRGEGGELTVARGGVH